jgi:hypothetical protein
MYPNTYPRLRLDQTISNPLNPAEVVGFVGRNKMLGQSAIVMKEPAIIGDEITIPTGTADDLLENEAELIVLDGTRVLAMTGSDFAEEQKLHTFEDGEKTETMHTVGRDNNKFRTFPQSQIEVGN